jgi:hypothetical protein
MTRRVAASLELVYSTPSTCRLRLPVCCTRLETMSTNAELLKQAETMAASDPNRAEELYKQVLGCMRY